MSLDLSNLGKNGGYPLPESLKDAWEAIETEVNSGSAVVGDGTITNAKLATDVKVGSLATLTTTATSDVVSAVNELDGDIGDLSTLSTTAKTSSVDAINELDGDVGDLSTLTTTAKTSAVAAINEVDGIASTAMQGGATVDNIRINTITQNGTGVTPVVFGSATTASVTGTNTETFDMTGVGDGGTFIANVDAVGAETATFNFAQGTSVSGASPSTDITGETDTKFNISVDGDTVEEVTLSVAGKNSGALIATEMQTKIQALGGSKASVTVAYTTVYTITSPTYGTGSSVVITPAASGNITEELKIGTADGGVETAGTGDVIDASAVTADEVVTVINADLTGTPASNVGGAVVITSTNTGTSGTVATGAGTLNTVLGFSDSTTYYGSEGLGYAADMADTNYIVTATLSGVSQASIAGKQLSITSKATTGFSVECEDNTSSDDVGVIIAGLSA